MREDRIERRGKAADEAVLRAVLGTTPHGGERRPAVDPDPLRALQILRDEIPESVFEAQRKRRSERQKGRREVILSAYLQAK